MSRRADLPAEPRDVGGLWCGQVLDILGDYVDGELSDATRASLEAHLRGCSWCADFGGRYSAVVSALRETLMNTEPTPDDVGERLARRLEALD